MIRWTGFETPFGPTWMAATSRGILRLRWGVENGEAAADRLGRRYPLWEVAHGPEALERPVRELREYFEGRRRRFEVEVDLVGLTPFQQEVLEAVRRIPFGETRSYGDVAEWLGKPGAARAVGGALGRNPVPILVPCHRVVRTDGSPGGYSAGAGYKEQLLELESRR